MGAIARRIATAGHDAQLHLHPCWLHYEKTRRRAYPELGKAIQKKTQALFLSANGAQHDGLGDRPQCGIFKITADAEFGVDRDADFDRFSGIHAL